MPFTPYHFGPGLLVKALLPTRLSAAAFCAAQVAVDLEPAYWMFIAREHPLHRGIHTLAAASLVGVAAGAVVAAAGVAVRRRLPGWPAAIRSELSAGAAILGGLLGGVLHVALDSVLYPEMQPLSPFSSASPLLGALSLEQVHALCQAAGVIGILGLLLRPKLWMSSRS